MSQAIGSQAVRSQAITSKFTSILSRGTQAAATLGALALGLALGATPVQANSLLPFPLMQSQASYDAPNDGMPSVGNTEDASAAAELPARFKRQVVNYGGSETAGTIVIDTPNTYLYFVLGGGKAVRYGIGVGREGFTWSGVQSITRKAEWPDWHPPADMLARQPYLPRFMAGGEGNPLGARAMYLGGTVYRIHGTNAPGTIGTRVSSGCIRLTNDDVADLYSRVNVGTRVVVMPMQHHAGLTTASAR